MKFGGKRITSHLILFLSRSYYQTCYCLSYGQSSCIFVTNSTTELVFDSVINNLSLLANINTNRQNALSKVNPYILAHKRRNVIE